MMDFNVTGRVLSEAHGGGKEKRSLDFIAQINVRMKQVWHYFSSLLPKVNQREAVVEARNTVLLRCG